jgi:hypothetical protein
MPDADATRASEEAHVSIAKRGPIDYAQYLLVEMLYVSKLSDSKCKRFPKAFWFCAM